MAQYARKSPGAHLPSTHDPADPHSAASSIADQSRRCVAQHTALLARRAGVGSHSPTRPTDPHSPTSITTHPKCSLQPIAPRRESPQQIKAAPRRAGQSHTKWVAGSRGIGRGVSEDAFAPTRPPSPPPVRCEWAGRTLRETSAESCEVDVTYHVDIRRCLIYI